MEFLVDLGLVGIFEGCKMVTFEKSRMMRFVQDNHLYGKFRRFCRIFGGEVEALKKLFKEEVLGKTPREMRYLNAREERIANKIVRESVEWTFYRSRSN